MIRLAGDADKTPTVGGVKLWSLFKHDCNFVTPQITFRVQNREVQFESRGVKMPKSPSSQSIDVNTQLENCWLKASDNCFYRIIDSVVVNGVDSYRVSRKIFSISDEIIISKYAFNATFNIYDKKINRDGASAILNNRAPNIVMRLMGQAVNLLTQLLINSAGRLSDVEKRLDAKTNASDHPDELLRGAQSGAGLTRI